jgi:surface-anchored protein
MQQTSTLLSLAFVLSPVAAVSAAVYSAGHGDFGVAYEGVNEWAIHFHFSPTTVLDGSLLGAGLPTAAYEIVPEDVIVAIPNSTRITTLNPVSFLGVGANTNIWVLPQTQQTGAPFLGFAPEGLEPTEWVGNIKFAMTGFSGPGNFALWNTDGFGFPTVFLRSDNGVASDDFFEVAPSSHAHFNLGFTQPGTYLVQFTVSGTHGVDGPQTATETAVFQVIPEPTGAALTLFGITTLLTARRRRHTP